MGKRFFSKPKSMEGYLLGVIILMAIAFTCLSNQFLTLRNLLDLAESYAVTCIFALGFFVVLVTGGIDISFAAIASVTQYIVATVAMRYHLDHFAFGILIGVACGIVFGCINALLIYYLNIISIIITISMQSLLFGLLMWLTKGRSLYDLPSWLSTQFQVFPFSIGTENYQLGLPLLIMFACILLTWLILNKFNLGRQLYAVGGNAESAHRVGIKVSLIYLFAYGYLGALSAVAGLLQVYRMNEVVPNALVGRELDVVAATVLGGASLSGGKGSVLGTIMGVFLIGILKNGLNLVGISTYFMDVVVGIVITVAITITHYKKRKETDVGFA